jgi:hypothetical protein
MVSVQPAPADVRFQKVAVRCSAEYREWVDLLGRRTARTRASVVEAALAEFAARQGLPEPPPRCGF